MSTDALSEFQEEYLEISPNILASFPKFRPPVALYFFNPEMNQVVEYCKADERLSTRRQEEIAAYAGEGRLFLSRHDYKVYAKLLSRQLGLVLTEPNLNPLEIAEIFHNALLTRLEEFYAQPLDSMLEPLRRDISILCEYLWADPGNAAHLKHPLGAKHTLGNHSVCTCLVGLALHAQLFGGQQDRSYLIDAGLGFLLHDIGMANVPEIILLNPSVLTRKDRMRMQEHTAVGVKMLRRLKDVSEEVIQCVGDHHERIDGTGYPRKLNGAQVTPVARICAVADAYCAMTSERVYAPRKEPREAVMALAKESKAYDPIVIKALARYLGA